MIGSNNFILSKGTENLRDYNHDFQAAPFL